MSMMDETYERLALANRILANEGVVDGFGHISVRHPTEPGQYLLSCSRSPALVTADDIMTFALDGTVIGADKRKPYLERFIHGALYEARDDIVSVVHNHAYEVLPFAITGSTMKPAIHVAAAIGENVPVWDIRDRFGNTDLLVTCMEHGRDLAATLGGGSTALMRGHGAVIAGGSIEQAVMTAIYLKVNAQILLAAGPLGDIEFLNDEEVRLCTKLHTKPAVVERIWDYFAQRAGKST